jgi:shikimate kinase
MRKVFLIGYMGSGKSTIAKALAQKTGIPHYDLDEVIEKRSENSISQIFEAKGELFFRLLEHEVLSELVASPESMILSWGGGTPCYANNNEFLSSENTTSIYLSASIENLYHRIVNEKEKRPMVANKSEEELKEFIAKHLFDRSFYYNQANFTIRVDQKSINEIVSEIETILA